MAEYIREINKNLDAHVLDVLRELVTESQLYSESQHEISVENATIEELEAEVARLQKVKDELSEKLKETQVKTVKNLVLNDLEEKVRHKTTKSISEDAIERIPLANKKRNIDLLRVAEAISGYSVFEQDKELVVRLETCFEGKFYEHYQIYLELEEAEEERKTEREREEREEREDKLKILHHTIPYFIPFEHLSKLYLNSNLKKFVSIISDYLNCYVARRQQLIQLSENETVDLREIQTSNASDYTNIQAEYNNKKYFLKIFYDDLLTTYPSRVEIFSSNNKNQRTRINDLSSIFLENRLKTAFDLAFPPQVL